MDLTQLAQSVTNGLVFGAILSLCAIGLTLVYGILNLANFAHGDTLTFGAYTVFLLGTTFWLGPHAGFWGLGFAGIVAAAALVDMYWTHALRSPERAIVLGYAVAVALWSGYVLLFDAGARTTTDRLVVLGALVAIGLTALLSIALDLALWRPLRRRRATVLSLVIASLGWSLVLRNGIQTFFGSDQVSLQRGIHSSPTYFGVHVSTEQWATVILMALVVVGVHLFVKYTRVGKAMRALADDRDLARVCGVDVDRVVLYVWALSSALVAIAGVLLCVSQENNTLNVGMGFGILIPIFASVILGGIGSPYGAMAGGFVVGVAMKLAPQKYDLAVAFLVLAATLLVRPQGILGRKR